MAESDPAELRRAQPAPGPLARFWSHDPAVVFLNHGSFGGVPIPVQEEQARLQARFQAEPVRFVVEELEPMLDRVRAVVGEFVGCSPDSLALLTNATTAVNAVVRSIEWRPGDEIITSNQEYNACNNALAWTADRFGLRIVRADLPFPIRNPAQALEAYLACASPRTRLALVSHVTSPTAVVLPVERIVPELQSRGVDVLVDGAHAPGMLPLRLDALGAAYYTGNLHKWACAPPGAAFLHVRDDRRDAVRPLVISHGANSRRTDRPRFRLEFDYVGSMDFSAWLAVPRAIEWLGGVFPGGWAELYQRQHALALAARDLLCRHLDAQPPAPDSMLGFMAAVPLPQRTAAEAAQPTPYHDPLQDRLIRRHGIQVPIIPFPAPPRRLVRISAAPYNSLDQFELLAAAIRSETA